MTVNEINLLKKYMIGWYREYGAGNSTLLARKTCNPVSIETDRNYAVRFGAIWCDIGETKKWGYPVSTPTDQQIRNYLSYARDYDALLIDGRYRVAVASGARPGVILLHDYDRQAYHVVESFMTLIDRVDSLAVFEKHEPCDVINFYDPY